MIHYELSLGGLWYDVYEALTEGTNTNSNWHWDLATDFTNSHQSERKERTEGDTGCGGEKEKHSKGSMYQENTPEAYLCVYFLKMLLVVIFQYQILLAWEILRALQQTVGVLLSLVTKREGAAAPYWPFIWTHRGHIASLWRNIQLITLESGLTGREQTVDC